jgi:hypothetical protein
MSDNSIHLLHWLSIRWPYVIATALALFFVVAKGFSVLTNWFELLMLKSNMKKLRLVLNKMQVEPQLVRTADSSEIGRFDIKKVAFKRIDKQTSYGKAEYSSWFALIGIVIIFVVSVALFVWLFHRTP